MITTCTVCKKGKFDYSMSDITLIPNTNPPEASLEGICNECSAYVHIKFKAYQAEITEFDELMNEKEKKIIIMKLQNYV